MTYLIVCIITFIFTTVLTIAGVGAAFILIPVFVGLGVPLLTAMSTALLLNSIAMAIASSYNARSGLIVYKVALPILVFASVFSPVGAITAEHLSRTLLLWLFVGFLIFAGSMMLWYKPKKREISDSKKLIIYGVAVGGFAGYIGGLLGVGGNLIVPALVWLGFDPKKASSTNSFIVIFSSFSGFLGYISVGNIAPYFLVLCAIGSIAAGLFGNYLMRKRLTASQVKKSYRNSIVYHHS